MNRDIVINAREIAKDFTLRVQVKNIWLVYLGLFFIRIGCWLGGFSFVDEFPISLIQPEEDEA